MSDLIIEKYNKLPKEIQIQVLEFMEFLMQKYQNKTADKPSIKLKSNYGSAKGLIIMSDDFDEPLDIK